MLVHQRVTIINHDEPSFPSAAPPILVSILCSCWDKSASGATVSRCHEGLPCDGIFMGFWWWSRGIHHDSPIQNSVFPCFSPLVMWVYQGVTIIYYIYIYLPFNSTKSHGTSHQITILSPRNEGSLDEVPQNRRVCQPQNLPQPIETPESLLQS